MNGANPADATGITEHQAADAIASLLADDPVDNREEGEAQEGEDGDDAANAEADEGEDGSEAEGADESESGEEEDDEGDDPQELADDAKVKIGDDEVTLLDLKRGYLRQADYTRKTQALAEERSKHAAESKAELEGLRAERAQFVQNIHALQELAKQYTPQEPDWAQLYADNPAEYAAQREMFRSYHDGQAQLEVARRAALQQSQEDYRRELAAYVQEQKGKLLEAMPEWKDAKIANAAKAKIRDYALAAGFSEEELNGLTDHRAFLTVHKAALYDELQAKRKTLKPVQVKQGAPRVAKPGNAATAPNSRTSDATRARQRLAQTGKVHDAANAILHILPDDI